MLNGESRPSWKPTVRSHSSRTPPSGSTGSQSSTVSAAEGERECEGVASAAAVIRRPQRHQRERRELCGGGERDRRAPCSR